MTKLPFGREIGLFRAGRRETARKKTLAAKRSSGSL
jgi:hypothetical protein